MIRLPDSFIEKFQQYTGQENAAKMWTAEEMAVFWMENGQAYESQGMSLNTFIESLCASVADMAPASGYNRMRVGMNVILRNIHQDHDVISFSAWLALLRNLKKGEDGFIPVEDIQKRIDWWYDTFDEFGKPPGVRDINKHTRKNGDKSEWEILWGAVVRNCKKILDLEGVPESKYKLAREVAEVEPNLSSVGAGYIGGLPKK